MGRSVTSEDTTATGLTLDLWMIESTLDPWPLAA